MCSDFCFLSKRALGEKVFSCTLLREKLWFHGVDYFSSQSLKDEAQGRRDCSPFRCTTMGLLSLKKKSNKEFPRFFFSVQHNLLKAMLWLDIEGTSLPKTVLFWSEWFLILWDAKSLRSQYGFLHKVRKKKNLKSLRIRFIFLMVNV